MFIRLLLLFTLIPLAEISLLIYLGKFIGLLPTIFLVGITGFIGVYLIRAQGFGIMQRIRQELAYGNVPGNQLLEGFLMIIGSAFLLTPGLITDTVGFALLLPVTRVKIRELLKLWLRKQIDSGNIQFYVRF